MTEPLRHGIDAYPVFMGNVVYEPWTDETHHQVGWKRSKLDGTTEFIYLVVVDDTVELRHSGSDFSHNTLHTWQPHEETP